MLKFAHWSIFSAEPFGQRVGEGLSVLMNCAKRVRSWKQVCVCVCVCVCVSSEIGRLRRHSILPFWKEFNCQEDKDRRSLPRPVNLSSVFEVDDHKLEHRLFQKLFHYAELLCFFQFEITDGRNGEANQFSMKRQQNIQKSELKLLSSVTKTCANEEVYFTFWCRRKETLKEREFWMKRKQTVWQLKVNSQLSLVKTKLSHKVSWS